MLPMAYTVDMASPRSLSKLVAESRLKPDLFLPVPGATALLALPTLTRDRVCCSGTASSIADTLAPPCLPIPACFRGCLRCLPAQVLTRTYRPTGPKMAGSGFAPVGAGLHGHSRLPHARAPPPASAFPFLGMEVHVQSKLDGNLSLCLVLEVSISARLPASALPVRLRAFPASVWCVLSSSQSLEKVCFLLSPSAGSPEGLVHPLEGPARAALQSLQAAFMAFRLPHVLLTTGVIRSTSQERSDNGGSGATVCYSLCTSRQSGCLVFILGCL